MLHAGILETGQKVSHSRADIQHASLRRQLDMLPDKAEEVVMNSSQTFRHSGVQVVLDILVESIQGSLIRNVTGKGKTASPTSHHIVVHGVGLSGKKEVLAVD